MAVNRSKRRVPLIDDYHLLTYHEVDSTNEEAKRLAIGGASHGAFIWSLRQSAGRGRRGRDWISHEGNLFTTALLEPGCNIDRLPQLSFVAAIAARKSIAPLLEDDSVLQFKWPNDLLLNGKKLAGLLLESIETLDEDGKQQRWAMIGLGMNIESAPDHLSDAAQQATYLKAAGVELVSAKIVLSRFIHHFIEWYGIWQEQGFGAIRKEWLEHCAHHDKAIEVHLGKDRMNGVFCGLDSRGNLRLQMVGEDEPRVIPAGEVMLP